MSRFRWRLLIPFGLRLYRSAAGGWYLNVGSWGVHITAGRVTAERWR